MRQIVFVLSVTQIKMLLLVLLFISVLSCTKASHFPYETQQIKSNANPDSQNDIKPLFDSEEIVELTPENRLLVKSIIEHAFKQVKSEAGTRNKHCVYFVKVLGKNPDPATLAGIEDDHVKVMPASMGLLKNNCVYSPQAGLCRAIFHSSYDK